MGMDSKDVLVSSLKIDCDGKVEAIFHPLTQGGKREELAKPITCNAGDHVRIYRGADGKLHGEIVPPPPKEPRYRRKPPEWTERISEFNKPYWHAESPFGECRIDEWVPGRCFLLWWESMKEDPTVEQAKARVEAEITRRLASVLEVCQ